MNDLDESILILEPFFWGNVIFKICSFCIKSHVWGRKEFLWVCVAPPDCNASQLRNECFSIHDGFALQSKSRHFTRGSQTIEHFRYINCDFWDRRANLENDKNGHRIKMPSSKLTNLMSSCWERISYAIMRTTVSFCSSFSWNYWS